MGRESKRKGGKGRPFLMVLNEVFDSASYGALSPSAVTLYLYVIRQFNGKNNGNLCTAEGTLKRLGLRMSKTTVRMARLELIEAGFIDVTRQGFRGGDGGKYPTLVRLTNEVCYAILEKGIPHCPASFDYRGKKPPEDGWRQFVKDRYAKQNDQDGLNEAA